MESSLRGLIDRIFAAMQAKNLDNVMSQFADDAVLIDPHFPHPRLEGKAAIAAGLQRAMTQMQSFGYTTVNYFESEGGQRAAVEMATLHLKDIGTHMTLDRDLCIGRNQKVDSFRLHDFKRLADDTAVSVIL